jgi:hypothetical protein
MMGTRADYYAGTGKNAEWLGSIAWDGEEVDPSVRRAKTERQYRNALTKFLQSRDDATFPEMGWPWPWDDSDTTDCAFTFSGGRFRRFKGPYPDMSKRKKVTFGARSGLVVIGT